MSLREDLSRNQYADVVSLREDLKLKMESGKWKMKFRIPHSAFAVLVGIVPKDTEKSVYKFVSIMI